MLLLPLVMLELTLVTLTLGRCAVSVHVILQLVQLATLAVDCGLLAVATRTLCRGPRLGPGLSRPQAVLWWVLLV